MNTLNFNDADLKANREGRLSDAQQKRLNVDLDMIHQHSKYMLWFMGAIFAVIFISGIINEIRATRRGLETVFQPDNLTGYVRIGATFLMLTGFVAVGYWWGMRGLTNGTIRTVEGTADIISTFITVKGRRVPLNRLRLRRSWYSRFTFHFDDSQSLRYFKNGRRYCVYYLPYAMPQALSAEEIEPEKAKR